MDTNHSDERAPSQSGASDYGSAVPGGQGFEKHIGRRAFIGLMVAGMAGLFLGKPLFSALVGAIGQPADELGFRINSVGGTPVFDETTWRITFDGLFRKPATLTFPEFLSLPQVVQTRDFYCVEGWGVKNVAWGGVALSEVMRQFDIDPTATHLILHSGDSAAYTDSVTLEEASREDTLLAHELNGEPLLPAMGQPVRLVLPNNYGYKYVKWVVRVEAVALDKSGYSGYWESQGYPQNATIR
jgi:DMSO/TMAO reductase YedYZ molybdopterin-dependent catalytic subunit